MSKLLFIFLILCATITNVEAGVISKTVKTYVAGKVIQKTAPIITKKMADKVAKKAAKKQLAQQPLRKNELKVGKYEDLIAGRPKARQLGEQTEQLDAHHMPSTKYIKNKGLEKGDGVAMEMQPERHSQTRTYGNKDPALLQETPREALGRDIKDARKVYQENGVYGPKVREALQEVIKQNKDNNPNLYKK